MNRGESRPTEERTDEVKRAKAKWKEAERDLKRFAERATIMD